MKIAVPRPEGERKPFFFSTRIAVPSKLPLDTQALTASFLQDQTQGSILSIEKEGVGSGWNKPSPPRPFISLGKCFRKAESLGPKKSLKQA